MWNNHRERQGGGALGEHSLSRAEPWSLSEWTAVVHEDRDGGENQLLIVSSAPEHYRAPPVSWLTDVLRISFCHLRTHCGDTLRTF